jgi:NAD(P)-dependent dehydrogenase (short-subunit alcohol dehydrogenase family)
LGGSLHYIVSGRTPAYSISKTALNALTMQPAAELANTCVKLIPLCTVNSVDPGWVATDMGIMKDVLYRMQAK